MLANGIACTIRHARYDNTFTTRQFQTHKKKLDKNRDYNTIFQLIVFFVFFFIRNWVWPPVYRHIVGPSLLRHDTPRYLHTHATAAAIFSAVFTQSSLNDGIWNNGAQREECKKPKTQEKRKIKQPYFVRISFLSDFHFLFDWKHWIFEQYGAE